MHTMGSPMTEEAWDMTESVICWVRNKSFPYTHRPPAMLAADLQRDTKEVD